MTATYLERLAARSASVGSVLCLGLDPEPTALPPGFSADLAGVERFVALLIEAAGPFAAAVKPNLAFYESHGSAGMAALERLRALVPSGLPVVIDAKRADIGSTAAHHAVALFDRLGADAVTVNPYMGFDSIAPYLEWQDRGTIVLCRTSNPGGDDFQNLRVDGEPLYLHVARRVATEWNTIGDCALVVGATYPAELAGVRAVVGDLPLLVPGIGAQGGDVAAAVRAGADSNGRGMIVNSSRAILYAGCDMDFADAARRMALATAAEIRAAAPPER